MNKRRDFLKASGALALGTFLQPHPLWAEAKAKKPIGLQLYSLRGDMRDDPQNTLRLVASIGYKSLETANYVDGKVYDMEPIFFRRYIEDLGMRLRSAHVGGPRDFDPAKKEEALDWWEKAISDHRAMGAKYIIKPSMPKPETLAELDHWLDYYNSIGELAKKAGMMFGFHNHAREFEAIEGQIMMDYMIEKTDPKLVCFELDVYWSQRGGQDPVEYLERYAGRFPVVHIKDEEEIGASGTLDFEGIFKAAYKQGMKDYFVEVERYNYEPIESVQMSFEYLNNSGFVK
jgi:sugar phosphate isomerase/epimerase